MGLEGLCPEEGHVAEGCYEALRNPDGNAPSDEAMGHYRPDLLLAAKLPPVQGLPDHSRLVSPELTGAGLLTGTPGSAAGWNE